MISIKMEPEVRHALAHIIFAVEALVKGRAGEAQYELEQIKALVFWDSDEGMGGDAEHWWNETRREENGNEEAQGQQEEVQVTYS